MSQLLRTWKLYPRQWKLIPARGFYSVRVTGRGKISAQPHTTLCIQFLDGENNDKNNTDLFYNSMRLCGNFTQAA